MEHSNCAALTFCHSSKWGHTNGIRGDDVYRLYLSDVEYSGTPHVLSVTLKDAMQHI